MAMPEMIISFIMALAIIPLNGLLLMLTAKIFKLKDQSYKSAFKITLILGVINLILGILSSSIKGGLSLAITIAQWVLISTLAALWLVKYFYKLDWGRALLIWLVWFVFYILLFILIILIVALFVVGLLFSGNLPIDPNLKIR